MLKGKKILLGITGSIAAYKTVHLVRLLVTAGADVKVIMTRTAADFVSPLTLSTLSRNNVLIDIVSEQAWRNHVALGRWADVMLIAPLSCNTLAKMANAQCDNLLLAVYLSATCPVLFAPAMDEDMWKHPATQKNIQTLLSFGNTMLPPENGELASGLIGIGRMQEPETIVSFLNSWFDKSPIQDLTGKKVLITAGPTREAIDPVRYISNHSSGKMGYALAKECCKRGADVILVSGPSPYITNSDLSGMTIVKVTSADEMYAACMDHFKECDITLMCAAVADFKPAVVSNVKIKKSEAQQEIKLVKTRDILESLGKIKLPGQLLLGFALETNNEEQHALEKLKKKNADFIVLNSLAQGNVFGSDYNTITIYNQAGQTFSFEKQTKEAAATAIINTLLENTSAA